MSKKQLLNESEIRRFMKLANLEPLGKNVVKENWAVEEEKKEAGSDAQEGLSMEEMEAPAMQPEQEGGEGEEVGLEMDSEGGEDSLTPEQMKMAEKVLSALFNKKVSLEGAEGGEEEGEEDEGDEGGEEEGEEDEGDEGGEEEMDESLSEDALVETVLARVTARLVAEAKKGEAEKEGKKPLSKAQKAMAAKKAKKTSGPAAKKESLELKGDKLEEATSAEGGGPLLKQGKNKYDVYKGHADMTMAKGDKGGKGGHSLETAPAKAEHTVTHGGKNLATLGGNKTKV